MNHDFPLQFSKSQINSHSLSCTLIKQLSNDGKKSLVSHGSGFFWRHQSGVYLVTARHVITGRSPFDNTVLSKQGYLPENLEVFPSVKILPSTNTWERQQRPVFVDQLSPNWRQDPHFNELKTDIAAIFVADDQEHRILCLNDTKDIFEELYTLAGMECTVVGYPTPHFSGLITPIWRKGSIASEPRLPLDDKPMFLLDAATSPGFSGAPVFRQHFGPLPIANDDGSLSMNVNSVRKISLVGVYAGRLEHAHFGGEVPFVFYANRIQRLFDGQ